MAFAYRTRRTMGISLASMNEAGEGREHCKATGRVALAVTLPGDSGDLVARAVALLGDVAHLLEALSPDEIEMTAARLRDPSSNEFATCWRLYVARFRAITPVFARQRALFAEDVRAYGTSLTNPG
jgi:hypothetical protein